MRRRSPPPRVPAPSGLDAAELVENAELKGASPLIQFAGDGALTFTY